MAFQKSWEQIINEKYQHTPSVEMELENGPEDELITVQVYFDFQPYEPMTRHYPGCSASVDICEVVRDDNGAELCLLKEVRELWEEQILDDHNEELRGGDPRW